MKDFEANESKVEFIMEKNLIDKFLVQVHKDMDKNQIDKLTKDNLFELYINNISCLGDFYKCHLDILKEINS